MRPFLFLLTVFITGCASAPNFNEIVLVSIDNSETRIVPSKNKLTVVYFLSPECPLCINYTLAMRELETEFASDSLEFYGVFSKEWYSSKEVADFQLKYHLGFDMLFDNKNILAKTLEATVTPEVFVLNTDGNVVYSGKIDNWVNDLGKKKLAVTERYLKNAIQSALDGRQISTTHTEPIGCLIE